eukprot:6406849-Amphidinium_carterae.1
MEARAMQESCHALSIRIELTWPRAKHSPLFQELHAGLTLGLGPLMDRIRTALRPPSPRL